MSAAPGSATTSGTEGRHASARVLPPGCGCAGGGGDARRGGYAWKRVQRATQSNGENRGARGRACPRDREASAASGNVQRPKTARRPSRCRRGRESMAESGPASARTSARSASARMAMAPASASTIAGRTAARIAEASFSAITSKKSQCKECGGSGLCPHQRRKSQCKECNGSGLCQHQRRRSTCKKCASSGLAEEECALRLAPPQGVTTGVKLDTKNADKQNISFLPAIVSTSTRIHGGFFLRLLFLQAHRETETYFHATGMRLILLCAGE